MFKQDYISRLIEDLGKVMAKVLFDKDSEPDPTGYEVMSEEEEQSTKDRLERLVDEGHICEAENELFDLTEHTNSQNMQIALAFYSHLNTKEDEFLEMNDFSREEITLGLKSIVSRYGLDSVTDVLLMEL